MKITCFQIQRETRLRVLALTLKQTNREKGIVTATKIHDTQVSKIPQTPTPLLSFSLAAKWREKFSFTQVVQFWRHGQQTRERCMEMYAKVSTMTVWGWNCPKSAIGGMMEEVHSFFLLK